MLQMADIAVYGRDGALQLVVEVKGLSGVSPEWAAELRRNLLREELLPRSPFFLLALRDFFYLWTDARPGGDERPPEYVIDAAEALAPYVEGTSLSLTGLSSYGLDLLVLAWLHDLARLAQGGEGAPVAPGWLVESGLYQAIRNGSIVTEDAA